MCLLWMWLGLVGVICQVYRALAQGKINYAIVCNTTCVYKPSGDVMPSPENITFDPAQLDTNSNYNVSVLASNIAGSAVSYTSISECCV